MQLICQNLIPTLIVQGENKMKSLGFVRTIVRKMKNNKEISLKNTQVLFFRY